MAVEETTPQEPKKTTAKRTAKKKAEPKQPEKPAIIHKADLIVPGWYRTSNTTITQMTDAGFPNGFKDRVLNEQKKSTFAFIVKYPRFAARSRNLWNVFEYSEETREHLLTLRNAECMRLDKADLPERLDYMEKVLGLDVSEFK